MQELSNNISFNRTLKRKIQRKFTEAVKKGDWAMVREIEPAVNKLIDKPNNLILASDGYKYSHHLFYEKVGLKRKYSYLESRGGKFSETLFYGLNIIIKKHLEGVAIIKEEVDEAYEIIGTKHGICNRDNIFDRSKFDYIVEKYGGRLPISIKAVKEGSVVGTKNVLMTIESLDENCAWLVNFLESLILQVWYPITVATLSREVKKVVTKTFLKCTSYRGEQLEGIVRFVLNDFGFRGTTSVESAAIGGSAHLVSHDGSDTVVASHLIRDIYNTDTIFGKTIPATEHSVMTLLGEEGEVEMMKNVLTSIPDSITACVSDSYNIFIACADKWGGELVDMVLARPPHAPLVIRPDSGHVTRTLIEVFKILFAKFGYTVNEKGYRVLPPQVRVIQGDGVNYESIREIYNILEEQKISPENLALGMGGKLLQAVDRDTQKFAFKCCFAVVDGQEVNVQKNPTEMDENGNLSRSFKKSKSGRLKLVKTETGYTTITSKDEGFEEAKDELVEVFRMGEILLDYTFEEIRERAKI